MPLDARTKGDTMTDHKVGTREDWLAARAPLLAREKEHTQLGDELAQLRRELPWVLVEKEYRFDTAGGARTLAELFDGRSQLVVYHFRPELHGWLSDLLGDGRQLRRGAPASGSQRRDDDLHLTRAAREAARLS
jgi:hypothetical protein